MSKKFLVNIDLNGNSLLNPVLNPLATAPSNANPYYIYTSTATADKGTIYVNTGTYQTPVWMAIGAVQSVNSKTGVVVLTQDDVGDGTTYVRTHNDLTTAMKEMYAAGIASHAATYSASATYAVGDFCTKDGQLYRCTTAITSAETWTAAHWTATTEAAELALKAPLASPALTGTPTAPTAATGTNTTQIATTAFVMAEVAALGEVMVFKGVVNSNSDLPATHTAGWTYKVGTAGTYAGITCEVGDTVVCITSGTAANNAHWYVLQANIDGAVTGPASATSGHIPTFDGNTGKVIKDGYGVASSISNDSTTVPTTAAVNTAVTGLIKTATGTIGTSATTATVNFTGTLINAYATMSGSIVVTDITPGSGSVTFTTAAAPSSAVTCTVVYT